jgi:hypothetical protein
MAINHDRCRSGTGFLSFNSNRGKGIGLRLGVKTDRLFRPCLCARVRR